jgi:hypothetical protein
MRGARSTDGVRYEMYKACAGELEETNVYHIAKVPKAVFFLPVFPLKCLPPFLISACVLYVV